MAKHQRRSTRPNVQGPKTLVYRRFEDEEPSRIKFRVLTKHGFNALEELPHDSGQHTTSRQLARRGVDQVRDGGKGVGHSSRNDCAPAHHIIYFSLPDFGTLRAHLASPIGITLVNQIRVKLSNIMDLAALPALGAVFTGMKNIYDMMKESGNTSVSEQLWDLSGKLLEVQNILLKLQQENIALRDKLSTVSEQLRIKEALVPFESMYWIEDEGRISDGPFCTYCCDKNKDLVRLQRTGEGSWYGREVFHYACNIHNTQPMINQDIFPILREKG